MTRGLRRTLAFLAMVAVGLLLVYLLADPFQRRRPAIVEAPAATDAARLKVKEQGSQRETQMVFGEVSFDVLPEDAESGTAALYRVHIQSGRPDETGSFLAEEPVITLLDASTGEPTGELSADSARFQVGSAVAGSVTIELGRMRVSHSELNGHVRGRFTALDGSVAELACERLTILDELVEAPGLVTWSREDLSISGHDMRWNGATGQLDFASDAHLVLPALAGRAGYDLVAGGGLTLVLPPDAADARAAAQGELRGRVTGSSTEGGALESDLLVLDGPSGVVTLTGHAAFEGTSPGGDRARLTAHRITLTSDADGKLLRADAEGDVRLAGATGAANAASAEDAAWLESASLRLEAGRASTPDRVTWGRGALGGAGLGLSWSLDEGLIELLSDASLTIAAEADHPLAGLRATAPGGLSWQLPAGEDSDGGAAGGTAEGADSRGELRGPVHGSLPDGSSFDGARLVYAGVEGGIRLEGDAVVRRETGAERSRLTAARIAVSGEDEGRTRLQAEGDVELETGAPGPGATPTRLRCQQLDAREGVLSCPGPVSWARGALSVEGHDLEWREIDGRIELRRDAHVVVRDAAGALELEAHAPGGLTWTAPADATDLLAQGQGELRGGVTGRTGDGSELEAELVQIDGPADTLTLVGQARVTRAADELSLRSDELVLTSLGAEPTVSARGAVAWESGFSQGRAARLRWDSAAGTLALAGPIAMQLQATGTAGAALWELSAEGSLDWSAPAGAESPLSEGRLELHGDVIGLSNHGETLRTSHLVVDGDARTLLLSGPSAFERFTDAGRVRLSAQRSIALQAADEAPAAPAPGDTKGSGGAGGPGAAEGRLVADGEARATLVPLGEGEPLHLSGERLSLDASLRTLTVEGPLSVAHGAGEARMTLDASRHLLVRVDELNAPVWFEAIGDVRLARGFEVTGDMLVWDVARDEATLEGACRMTMAGAAMDFERLEFQPRARRFKLLRSTVVADG